MMGEKYNNSYSQHRNNPPPKSKSDSERRNSKRFDEKLSAKIENEKCTVLNVSAKGVLLQTTLPVYFFPLERDIDFQLQVEGEWLGFHGTVMWIQSESEHSKLGLSIYEAPEAYLDFMKGLFG